jgi:tRNA pseudouridine55 synthase
MDGVLVVAKPQGLTSHDVVNRVRRLAGQRRVGHAGTLDPLATGVLLVCLGQATRIAEYLAGSTKRYRAGLRLGVATDTQDATGQVIAERPVNVTRQQVERALATLRGPILQVPPMFSALKHRGEALYRLARRGEEVERPARAITIYSLALTEWAPPDCEFVVHCSAGTYVRTLAHDLGERLGCGAHLTALVREASGQFALDEAVPLEQLEAESADGGWRRHLRPIAQALRGWPAVQLDAEGARRLVLGPTVAIVAAAENVPEAEALPDGEPLAGAARLACAFGPDGALLGLVRLEAGGAQARPEKIFAGQPDAG